MQMRAHHEIDFLGTRAGGGKPIEICHVEHVPEGAPRFDFVVAATRVDQDFLAADLQQPTVNGEPDPACLSLVVMGRKPCPVLGQMCIGEFRKDFPQRISRKVGFLDADNYGIAYVEQHRGPRLSAQLTQQFGDLSLLLSGQRPQGGCRYISCDHHGGLCHLSSAIGQRDGATTSILRIVKGGHKAP
jgi:hypothetical protein